MSEDSYKKILVFRTGQLGDMIVSLPAMWTVREQWPKAELTLLCDVHPGSNYVLGSEIFCGAGLFDHFEHYRVPSEGESKWLIALKRIILLTSLRRKRFDALVYLAASIRPRELVERDRRFFKAAGIKKFYGMNFFPPVPSRTSSRPMPAAGHEADLLMDRLKADGITLPPAGKGSLELGLGAQEAKVMQEWLQKQPSDSGHQWVGIGPGSKMPAKQWPVERFRQVINQLIDEFDVWPVVFGGTEDKIIGDELLASWGRGYNAAGSLDVRSASWALGQCALFLGNDTGTLHLAAAAGTPCVAVFSSRDWPGAWYPYGVTARVFRSEIECEGCYLIECIERQNECLKRTSTTEVIASCRLVLRQRLESKYSLFSTTVFSDGNEGTGHRSEGLGEKCSPY